MRERERERAQNLTLFCGRTNMAAAKEGEEEKRRMDCWFSQVDPLQHTHTQIHTLASVTKMAPFRYVLMCPQMGSRSFILIKCQDAQ